MTKTQQEIWKEQILADFPRLAQVPSVIDNMLVLWEKDPERFKNMLKKDMNMERKRREKEKNNNPEEPPTYDPEKFIINCITKEPTRMEQDDMRRDEKALRKKMIRDNDKLFKQELGLLEEGEEK